MKFNCYATFNLSNVGTFFLCGPNLGQHKNHNTVISYEIELLCNIQSLKCGYFFLVWTKFKELLETEFKSMLNSGI